MTIEKEMVFFASVVDGVNRVISDAAEKLGTGHVMVCRSCGDRTQLPRADAEAYLRLGYWPKCCGQTMELTSEMGT